MQTGMTAKSLGALVAMLLAFACGTQRLAGQNPAAAPDIKASAVDTWPDVLVNVIVTGKDGAPKPVDEHQFQLLDDDTERPLKVLGSPDSPLSLAILIDTSGSMFKRKDAILAAVKALAKSLPDGSEIAAVDFNAVAYIDVPFADASKADLSILDRLPFNGLTTLYDAIFATETYILANAKYPRRALVIVSDGADNASQVSIRNAFYKMELPGAPVVYACIPTKASVLQPDSRVAQMKIKYLAEQGGGFEFYLGTTPETAAAQIAEAIRNQYVLQFSAADPTRTGRARKLTVRLPDNKLRVHAMPVYFAPVK